METRAHVHEETFRVPPERVFALLHTPSAIRAWWGATRVLVVPRSGGLWAAAWGEEEDEPVYVSAFRIQVFEPPRRLVLADGVYFAKDGGPRFDADFVTEFTVQPRPGGSRLRVVQDGFPADPVADGFYEACRVGWKRTFEGIRRFLAGRATAKARRVSRGRRGPATRRKIRRGVRRRVTRARR